MTVEASASNNQSDASVKVPDPTRCQHPRCNCKRQPEDGKKYCSPCCEEKAATTGYCPCTHDGCYCECDLVMKGGITSGIVYPPLVYKLYENNYRFRNIGGTSAGAIMAALTAAAEYGRAFRGFEKLNQIKEQLGKGDFLFNLFQPSKETRPLYKFLMSWAEIEKGKDKSAKSAGLFLKTWRIAGKLQWASPARFLSLLLIGMMAGVGIAFALIALIGSIRENAKSGGSVAVIMVFGLLGALVGYLVAFGIGVYGLFKILTRKIPDNCFGMCTGLKADSTPEKQEALTEWLSRSINHLANTGGLKSPLTFGMLKAENFVKQREDENGIDLRMMTSNVSQNQPYVLPFADQFLLYKEAEFRKFFPKEIVEYMKEHAPKKPNYNLSKIPGYFFLPAADDLPVIVATRLSLSFPLLLCALPLYTIVPNQVVTDVSKLCVYLEETDLKLNWFSDGGIASNFPIQFFDAWLPTRPSFGINLTSLPDEGFAYERDESMNENAGGFLGMMPAGMGKKNKKVVVRSEYSSPTADTSSEKSKAVTGEVPVKAASKQKEAIYLPAADDLLFTEWVPLTKRKEKAGRLSKLFLSLSNRKPPKSNEELPNLFKFIWAIFTTAQNYRDNMQAMLPSYRERIVQIRLSDDEGGLNLAMGHETIKKVMKKGEEAGSVLLKDFDFRVHQWVRFQVLMSQMEKYLEKTEKVAREDPPNSGIRQFDYPALLKAQEAQADNEHTFPYRRDEDWCRIALERMESMGKFIESWPKKPKLSDEPPLPESVLRVTPEI